MASKKIEIKVKTADSAEIEKFKIIQGDLKELTVDNYERLKGQIVKNGFSAPIFVWKGLTVLDGTQRIRTLMRMKNEEGFLVPPIPYVEIEASSKKQAMEKLMGFVSQYGKVTKQGVYEFFNAQELDFNLLSFEFSVPDFDVVDFRKDFLDDSPEEKTNPEEEWQGMPEFTSDDKRAHRQILVSFANDEDVEKFAELIEQNITDKTRFLWYPKAERASAVDKAYEQDD